MPGRNGTVSRRRPWPYDAYVGGVRVMLKPGDDGNLVGRKSKTLEATAPITFAYSSANPYKERTAEFKNLVGGMGLGIERNGATRRYSHSIRADCSVNGRMMKGPLFHTETIDTSPVPGEVRQTILALHGGVEVLFALCENGVWRRTADDTWVESLTVNTVPALTSGHNPQQAVRFKGRYGSAIDALYVGCDSGNIWQYTGSVWVQPVDAQGPGLVTDPGECRAVERVGDELWVAGDYWVTKCEADPLLRASWSAPIWIGDQSARITWLKQIDNQLIIFKEDGWYSISTEGIDQELFPSVRGKLTSTNGRQAAVWLTQMWVPYGDQLYRFSAEGAIAKDGLDMLLDNTSDIRGTYVAGAGHNTWFMYEVYYNESQDTSYLVKHGTWVTDPETEASDFVDVHHGSLAQWSKRAVSCYVISGVHSTGNDRLYLGFDDGTVEWCVLPRTSPDPSQDTACEFTPDDSFVYLPTHHANFQADNKLWQGVSVFGPSLTTTEYVTVAYRLTQSNLEDWSQLVDEDTTQYTLSGQRIDFEIDPPVYSKQIQLRIKLNKDEDLLASPVYLTPVIDGIGVHESIRPSLSLEYTMDIWCSSFMPKRNGTIDRRRGAAIRDALLAVAAEVGIITIVLPNGAEEEVAVFDFADGLLSSQNRRDLEYTVRLTCIQVRTITPQAQLSGITYAQLETYTLEELESII